MSQGPFLKNKDIAAYLGVSNATISNWKKSGLLPEELTLKDLKRIRHRLNNRKKARANKAQSNKTFIPKEYLHQGILATTLQQLISLLSIGKDLRQKIALCSWMYLICHQEIIAEGQDSWSFRRAIVENLVRAFCPEPMPIASLYAAFEALQLPQNTDLLGLLYQSLKTEGEKSSAGSYFTPPLIVEDALDAVKVNPSTVLDPCCGSGGFLLRAAKKFSLPMEGVLGIDVDPIAVYIAKINLLLQYPDQQAEPCIFLGDSLNDTFSFGRPVDLVISNPPWGANKNRPANEDYATLLGSGEIFSMFILHSLSLLREGGEMAFILPESLLNIHNHKNIRHLLLTTTQLMSIKDLGRPFSAVLSKVIRLNVLKAAPKQNRVRIDLRDKRSFTVAQQRFMEHEDCIIDYRTDDADFALLKKIESVPHFTLEAGSRWALGIVTGNNEKFVSSRHKEGTEPVYRGNDVECMRLKPCKAFIRYERESFQQVASDEMYRAKEKLIYRFIASRLTFAYDCQQSLTLNSANILIPEISGYDMRILAALLNSEVLQFVFRKRFFTSKILQNDLLTLPLPVLNEAQKQDLLGKAVQFLEQKTDFSAVNAAVNEIFGLTEREIQQMAASMKGNL